jgi:hypothetical protein
MAKRRLAREGQDMMRRRLLRVAAPAVAALLTVVLMALMAGAHHTDFADPNDTRGKLDVRSVRFAHRSGPPSWTIVTFAEWKIAEMWDRGFLMVLLDTKEGPAADHYLLVRSDRVDLKGSLWRVRSVGPDSLLGSVPVKRLSRQSATVQVGLFRLTFGEKRSFYRWWVQTLFTNDVCRRTCQDRAPNEEPALQWRPGMSPSPSPSSSASPSP